jgi:hypothetical protein
MAKLKQWFKRLRCWLTGCKLSSTGIASCKDEINRTMIFRNRCVRCGQVYRAEVPIEALLDAQPIRLEVADGKIWK